MKVRRLKATVCALCSLHTSIIHSTRRIRFQSNINFRQTSQTQLKKNTKNAYGTIPSTHYSVRVLGVSP